MRLHNDVTSPFRLWAESWRSEPGRCRGLVVTFLAFPSGIVIGSLGISTALSLAGLRAQSSQLHDEIVNLLLIGAAFLIGILLFYATKSYIFRSRTTTFGKIGARAIATAIAGVIVWIAGFLAASVALGSHDDFQARIQQYSIKEWGYLLLVIVASITVQATSEELVFRGYLLPRIAALTHPMAAVAISAAIFSVFHLTADVLSMAAVFAFGIATGISVLVTGNIAAAALFHVVLNVTSFSLTPAGETVVINDVFFLVDIALIGLWLATVVLIAKLAQQRMQVSS